MSDDWNKVDPRDHGFPNESLPIGTPQVVTRCNTPCPTCGCKKTFGIRVKVRNVEIGVATGRYRGCAACEWASIMDVRPSGEPFNNNDYNLLD